MSDTGAIEFEGSFRMPAFEHARVSDVMRTGVLTCPPEASLAAVARTMATHHIHSVVVEDGDTWALLSDLDLVRSARDDTITAGELAASDVPTVTPDDTLERAAALMGRHGTAHLVVVDPEGRRPIGMLSSLDVAGSVAWGRA